MESQSPTNIPKVHSDEFGILIIDDDSTWRATLQKVIYNHISHNFQIYHAENLSQAREILYKNSIKVILLDMQISLPDGSYEDGIDAVDELLSIRPMAQVAIVTSSENIEDASRAMDTKACTFICKSFKNPLIVKKIKTTIKAASNKCRLLELNNKKSTGQKQLRLPMTSSRSVQVMTRILASSRDFFSVLIQGETGSGKSVIAHLIHQHFKNNQIEKLQAKSELDIEVPFFKVDLASISTNLLKSELFGHEKGAFTGANQRKIGFFEAADGGVLFLDEIGDAPLDVQAKLFTVLDDGEFTRVGGTETIKTNVKVISATNHDLKAKIAEGKFREELYHRISTHPIEIPSLSERKEDIPEWIEILLPEISNKSAIEIKFTDIPESLISHIFDNVDVLSGNVRELRNFLVKVIANVPRDKHGNPILSQWRKALDKASTVYSYKDYNKKGETTKASDILKNGIDVTDPEFKKLGLTPFINKLKKKIVLDAQSKAKTYSHIGEILNCSKSQVAQYMNKYGVSSNKMGRPTKPRSLQ